MLKRRNILIVVLSAVSFGVASPVSAQAPEQQALDALRTRSSIPPGNQTIDAWITYRLARLREDLSVGMKQADDEFLGAYQTQCNHPENSAAFKTRFIERTNQRFAAEFGKGRGLEVTVGLTIARAIAGIGDLTVLEGLSAGLKADGQPAARYVCAKTFATLIPAVQGDTAQARSIIDLLREAGVQESNGIVLARIYQALEYRGVNLKTAVEAILDVITAQLRMREAGAPACDGAEQAAFAFLRSELSNIQDKNRLVAVLGACLRLDVNRYLADGVTDDEKYFIELTVDAAEALLLRAVAPAAPVPNVREAMKNLQNQDLNAPLELNRWIGTTQTPGTLNTAPWNVPVGAPVPD